MDVVNVLIQDKPVVIFSKSSCCMSHSVETLIRGFGANPTVYDLDRIPNGQQIERALMQLGFRQSVPAVFIGQQLVGNERNVMSLHIQNQLVPLLIQADCKIFLLLDNLNHGACCSFLYEVDVRAPNESKEQLVETHDLDLLD
ncbi:hypothetical protein H0E87_024751 [Populus deltoides]|uniref:Glutaredoxin domain-containing protein n=1 Tax=Populus deltoides TaxID=3696 RepID=A0A8T2X7L8_POPDE|nr:hypothetical protein H0E87_024751 [Populus deltoides]